MQSINTQSLHLGWISLNVDRFGGKVVSPVLRGRGFESRRANGTNENKEGDGGG